MPQCFGTPDLTPIRTGFTPGIASHQLTPASGQFQATFSAVTGEPTPTQTTVVLSAPAQQAPPQTQPQTQLAPVTRFGTTETLLSTVASSEIPIVPVTHSVPHGTLAAACFTSSATESNSWG